MERILLKADTSEAGEGWTDREIAAAFPAVVEFASMSLNLDTRALRQLTGALLRQISMMRAP
jgi:hypothetical protein